MARNLAFALLQYHQTPWLQTAWMKKKLGFLTRPNSPDLGTGPFLEHQFPLNANQPAQSETPVGLDAEHCKDLLFWYGVTFLELWHGQAFEDRQLREQLLAGNPASENHINFVTAMDWQHELEVKISNEYGNLIPVAQFVRRCIVCDFGGSGGLNGKGFRRAFYNEVVLPIDDLMKGMGWA